MPRDRVWALRYHLPKTGDGRIDDFLEELIEALEDEIAQRYTLEEKLREVTDALAAAERAIDRQDGQLSTLESVLSDRES